MTAASITLNITNPTPNEVRKIRQMVATINSNKKPGENRASVHETKK